MLYTATTTTTQLCGFLHDRGCGISREMFDRGLTLPPQIRAFYKFHMLLREAIFCASQAAFTALVLCPRIQHLHVTSSITIMNIQQTLQ